jgi:hypothetical protein
LCRWGECGAAPLYSTDLDAEIHAVAADASGIVAWGTAKKTPTDSTSYGVLFVLDLAGQPLARNWVDMPLYETGRAVITNTGDVLVSGSVKKGVTGATLLLDGVVARLDRSGTPRWQQTLAGDSIGALGITPAGDAYVVGGGRDGYGYVALMDASGALKWRNRYPAALSFHSVIVDPEGGAVVHGCAQADILSDAGVSPRGALTSLVARYANDGQLVWLKQAPVDANTWGQLSWLGDDSFVLAELTFGGLLQISQRTGAGDVLWTQRFQQEGSSAIQRFESLASLLPAGSDAVFLAGSASISSVISNNGGFHAEFDLGTRKARWLKYFFDYVLAAAVDPRGNLILTGRRNCDGDASCDPSHSYILSYPP